MRRTSSLPKEQKDQARSTPEAMMHRGRYLKYKRLLNLKQQIRDRAVGDCAANCFFCIYAYLCVNIFEATFNAAIKIGEMKRKVAKCCSVELQRYLSSPMCSVQLCRYFSSSSADVKYLKLKGPNI